MAQRNFAVKIDAIKNTGEVIAQTLKDMIYEGQFKPGQQLKQDSIAEMFGVSRVPVRDALNMLIHMRLAVNVPRRGVIVHPLSKKLLEELFEIRVILESAAIITVVRKQTSDLMSLLAECIEKQKQAQGDADVKRAEELDEYFHTTIFRVTGNQTLNELIYANWMRIKQARCASSLVIPENGIRWIKNSIRRHELLLAALRSNDETRAHQIVVQNIESSFYEVISCLEEMGWLESQ